MNAFREFTYLRKGLRRLVAVSQLSCGALDDARLNLLSEIQNSAKHDMVADEMELGATYYLLDSTTKAYRPFECTRKYSPDEKEWLAYPRSRFLLSEEGHLA